MTIRTATAGFLSLVVLSGAPALAATLTLQQTFDDPTVTGSDFFGTSVALDGDNVPQSVSSNGSSFWQCSESPV